MKGFMMTGDRLGFVLAVLATAAVPAAAADVPASLVTAASCAPRLTDGNGSGPALRVVAAQDVFPRHVSGDGDLVIVGGGTDQGVQLGQQYFISRPLSRVRTKSSAPWIAVATAGRLEIIAVNEAMAIGRIQKACDGVLGGDYLEPYAEVPLPEGFERTETAGELDFDTMGEVLYGDSERNTSGVGEFVIAAIREERDATPGARFAIYRDVRAPGVPLVAVGEAVVMSANGRTAIVRLTQTRDAVQGGDLLVPRRRP